MLHNTFHEIIYQLNQASFTDDQFKKACFGLSTAPKHILDLLWQHSMEHSSTRHEVLFLFRDLLDLLESIHAVPLRDS